MSEVQIMLFNSIGKAVLIDKENLLKHLDVKYITTDYELSGYDIYKDIYTGVLYATRL